MPTSMGVCVELQLIHDWECQSTNEQPEYHSIKQSNYTTKSYVQHTT